MEKWDKRFVRIAREVAHWSKDPSSKVGSVAVIDNRIISTGYNGFPAGIEDTEIRYNNRVQKYKYIVHSEMNTIYNSSKIGNSLAGATLYVWGLPVCSDCAKGIASAGIVRVVVSYNESDVNSKWLQSLKDTVDIFHESGIILDTYPLLKES